MCRSTLIALTYVFLSIFWSPPARAVTANCDIFLSGAQGSPIDEFKPIDWTRIARLQEEAILSALVAPKELNLTDNNWMLLGGQLNQDLSDVLRGYERRQPKWKGLEQQTREARGLIFRYAHENVLQHGSPEHLNRKTGSSIGHLTIVPIVTKISNIGTEVIVTITNPQIKPFPKSLEREFTVQDSLCIPLDERVGYTGCGMATGFIVDSLKRLPEGSTAKWEAADDHITFTLKFHLPEPDAQQQPQ